MATTKKPGDQASTTKPGSSTSRPGGGATARPGTGQPSRPGTGQPSRPGTGQPTRPTAPIRTTTPATTPSRPATPSQPRRQFTTAEGPTTPTRTTTPAASTTPATTTTTGTVPPVAEPFVPVDWQEAAKDLYGGYFAIIQSVPELQDLLQKAIANEWGEARFQYELQQTAWFKQNSATAREWDLTSQLDPASAQQQIENRVVEFQNLAMSNFQVQLNDAQLRKLATDSLRFGWTQQMVTNAIGLEATRTTGGLGQLASGFVGQNVRQTANNYGLKLSDDSLNQWVSAIATGNATQQSFQQYAINTAKNLFPAISAQLDTGLTFQQVVDPFRNVAAQILEISPDSIDFIDPKWARAISTVDQGGQQRMMSFSEWGDYLRNERSFGYEYTSDAQTKAFEVANNLANLFGRA